MTLSDVMDIAVSGLLAQRARMTVTASNLANAQTTHTTEGGPYRRRDPVFEAQPLGGPFGGELDRAVPAVSVSYIAYDSRPPIPRHMPGHPDADAQGFVDFPRVNPVEELTNLMSAERSFESNLLILRKARQMAEAVSSIGR